MRRPAPQLAVVLPVHDEQELLPGSLVGLERAVVRAHEAASSAEIVIVLDSCSDESESIVRSWRSWMERRHRVRVSLADCEFRNVGAARRLGCELALSHQAGAELWIATSDADSQVPANWLLSQLSCRDAGYDAWAGRVKVADGSRHHRSRLEEWRVSYERERQPIHGANLGFDASWYTAVGGFATSASGEDRELVHALVVAGARVYFDGSCRVTTSSRRQSRAPDGFAGALDLFEAGLGAPVE
jgi:glycosyltransferase involved in cell wall biosynthesis